jgi:fucose 4-O-acetylase-like acetyltransferase
VERRTRPRNRELYIDAFRGLMALVMVQGHVFDALLSAADRAHPAYQFQVMFHGSTAPGFLFASGFVAGLPRAPLSLRATARRARRLLFVLGIGYFLHLPYFSLWKVVDGATAAERAHLFACGPLLLIAVTQLALLGLQWIAGRHWVAVSGWSAALVIALAPVVWVSHLSERLPLPLAAYLDMSRAPSQFPLFPFSAFVFAGAAAGAVLGRQEPRRRRRRAVLLGAVLLALGAGLAAVIQGRIDFWSVSPAYAVLRLGGLVLLLLLVELAAARRLPGIVPLALLGHETLLVYVLHLLLLFGGVLWHSPLAARHGTWGFLAAFVVLFAMVPVLYAAARLWHAFKSRSPHEGTLLLAFFTLWFLWEFATRPW